MHAQDTIHGIFEAQACKYAQHAALVYDSQRLSYQELNEKANQLAHAIRDEYQNRTGSALEPDTLIVLCLERSFEMIAGVLGVLKAGAAYVPIDPHDPVNRIRYFLQDTQSIIIVTTIHLKHKLQKIADANISWIMIDDPKLIESENKTNLCNAVNTSSLAYVIYTSGTTGVPKGVMQTHENVLRLFKTTVKYFMFNQQDVWVLYHAYSFDFSVWEIWGALLYGATLLIPRDEERRDPHLLYKLCLLHHVTILNFTPGVFFSFVQCLSAQQIKMLHTRLIILGGEKLQVLRLQLWWDKVDQYGPCLVNMYGITETTVHVTLKILSPTITDATCVIGKALDDMVTYVLDEHQSLVSVGDIGELYVGGAGLARGYLNKPELTAERFMINPFVPNSRLYKTGDLVRQLPNQELEYIGRNDSQVKIRGFRIELGEIEKTLLMNPFIEDCVVMAHTQTTSPLVCYYISQKKLDEHVLRLFLKERLPDYMVPHRFIHRFNFPMTRHGKIDREALLEPALQDNNDSYERLS